MNTLLDRFLRYVRYDTQSDETSTTFPSTDKQRILLRALTDRCAELDLRLRAQSAGVEVTAFLATLASHYRLTGKFKQS